MEEKRPTAEQMAKFKKNSEDKSLTAEIRAKFKAIVDKFSTEVKDIEGEKPKATRGRKPASTATTKKPATPKTKQTATDVEKAKAEIKAKTGKTEAECESIIEQYRALRTKAQEGKRKAEQASADNKKRVEKLDKKGDIIAGTNEKTADAVIESTAKDVVEKIEKEVEVIEAKAETEAKAEVAKDTTITTPKAKKEAIEAKVEKKVAEKTKTIVKRVVIDTSALLTSIATSLGKFDKDSQKEFLIKLRSDIDKLLSKYSAGGITDGAVQVMNIQQSNLSASSVNPTLFANGGQVSKGDKYVRVTFYYRNLKNISNQKPISKPEDIAWSLSSFTEFINSKNIKGNVTIKYINEDNGIVYDNETGKRFMSFSEETIYAQGGVVGQEIVFDYQGEEKTGVIKEISNSGDYIVSTEDGRTLLAQRDRDVISLGKMREKARMMDAPRKRFGFFNEGGGVDGKIPVTKIDKVVQHYNGTTWELDKYPSNVGGSAKEWMGNYPLVLEDAKALVFELAPDEAYDYEDEINNAEDIDDLKSVISDFKYFQSDNTYNQSWWGGVVDWSSLTESGDAYERALVFVNMHNGGDPRGNYSETQAFEVETLFEDYPPYASRLTYYIMTFKGTLVLDTDDMEGYTLVVNEDETGTYEEGDYVTLDELEDNFDLSEVSLYAKGGLTEHGLRVGDRIEADGKTFGYKDEIQVIDSDKKRRFVNLDKGNRGIGFKRGGITEMLRNRRGN